MQNSELNTLRGIMPVVKVKQVNKDFSSFNKNNNQSLYKLPAEIEEFDPEFINKFGCKLDKNNNVRKKTKRKNTTESFRELSSIEIKLKNE